jgi:hypothetical protein
MSGAPLSVKLAALLIGFLSSVPSFAAVIVNNFPVVIPTPVHNECGEFAAVYSSFSNEQECSDDLQAALQKMSDPVIAREGITENEEFAIAGYKHDTYSVVNSALRSHDLAQLKRYEHYIDTLKSAVLKAPLFQGVVRRGTDLPASIDAQHFVGNIVTYDAFTSTSMGTGFIHRDFCLVITSKTGRAIEALSPWGGATAGEEEVLFLPGTQFKVVDRSPPAKDCTHITLEEI